LTSPTTTGTYQINLFSALQGSPNDIGATIIFNGVSHKTPSSVSVTPNTWHTITVLPYTMPYMFVNWEISGISTIKDPYAQTTQVYVDKPGYIKAWYKQGPTPTLTPPDLVVNNPTTDCPSRKVTITGQATPTTPGATITRIHWNWGDGAEEDHWFPNSHTYASDGTYTITVTAYDSNGLSTTKNVSVVIACAPATGDIRLVEIEPVQAAYGTDLIVQKPTVVRAQIENTFGRNVKVQVDINYGEGTAQDIVILDPGLKYYWIPEWPYLVHQYFTFSKPGTYSISAKITSFGVDETILDDNLLSISNVRVYDTVDFKIIFVPIAENGVLPSKSDFDATCKENSEYLTKVYPLNPQRLSISCDYSQWIQIPWYIPWLFKWSAAMSALNDLAKNKGFDFAVGVPRGGWLGSVLPEWVCTVIGQSRDCAAAQGFSFCVVPFCWEDAVIAEAKSDYDTVAHEVGHVLFFGFFGHFHSEKAVGYDVLGGIRYDQNIGGIDTFCFMNGNVSGGWVSASDYTVMLNRFKR